MWQMQRVRDAMQAQRKAAGLPWYGGRPPGRSKVEKVMADALVTAESIIDGLPAVRDVPDDQKTPAELLSEGTREGLILQRDTIRAVQAEFKTYGLVNVDMKLLRLGNEIGRGLAQLSLRVEAGEMRARQVDFVGQLLARLAAARSESEDR